MPDNSETMEIGVLEGLENGEGGGGEEEGVRESKGEPKWAQSRVLKI